MQQGRSINLDVNRVVSTRYFCNKMWQATRYCLSHLEDYEHGSSGSSSSMTVNPPSQEASLLEKWLLNKLARLVKNMNTGMDKYEIASATTSFRLFFLNDFCDTFIEFSKPVLYNTEDENALQHRRRMQETLQVTLDTLLRLSHPLLPFITEELWQRLPANCRERNSSHHQRTRDENDHVISIMTSKYPSADDFNDLTDTDSETRFESVLSVMQTTRALRSTTNALFAKGMKPEVEFYIEDEATTTSLSTTSRTTTLVGDINGHENAILNMAKLGGMRVITDGSSVPTNGAVVSTADGGRVTVALLIPNDAETAEKVELEIKRLEKRSASLEKNIGGLEAKVSNVKIPEEQRNKSAASLNEKRVEMKALLSNIEELNRLL